METAINIITAELYANLEHIRKLKRLFSLYPTQELESELGRTAKEIEELQRAINYLKERFIGI